MKIIAFGTDLIYVVILNSMPATSIFLIKVVGLSHLHFAVYSQ